MITVVYRLLFICIVVLLGFGFSRSKSLYERLTFAFVAIPFALRALNIK